MAIAMSSVIASFASMPFALYHFGITTSWSVAANMIGMPLMGLIIMPMGVAAMVLSVFGAEAVPLYVMNAGIISLSFAAEYISITGWGKTGGVSTIWNSDGFAGRCHDHSWHCIGVMARGQCDCSGGSIWIMVE
jgi:predicted membrane metal-binding protein